jgi:hypothetical protein
MALTDLIGHHAIAEIFRRCRFRHVGDIDVRRQGQSLTP